mmetsp:Transcript_43970/g.110448  ORF Transcript_43970/g.110448 Transcript_43970/m.110448 type:complete len:206 (+) Transcript_43970:394-1011(+)
MSVEGRNSWQIVIFLGPAPAGRHSDGRKMGQRSPSVSQGCRWRCKPARRPTSTMRCSTRLWILTLLLEDLTPSASRVGLRPWPATCCALPWTGALLCTTSSQVVAPVPSWSCHQLGLVLAASGSIWGLQAPPTPAVYPSNSATHPASLRCARPHFVGARPDEYPGIVRPLTFFLPALSMRPRLARRICPSSTRSTATQRISATSC